MLKNLWQSNGFQLLFGIIGIYTCYWIAGILQQKISKMPYQVTNTIEWDTFQSPVALLYVPCGAAWLFGFLVNKLFYKEHTHIPATNLIACAIMVCISTHTYMVAIYLTNFPIVMLVKSCNIISVVLVGVFCSRVKDKSLALGPKKIIIASLISFGIILYNFGGNQQHKDKATDPLGVVLLLISLIADGFLPDFQASIKSQFHPRPMQMFQHINKWAFIISLTYALLSGQFRMALQFNNSHPQMGYNMLLLSVLTTIGQVFVYRMIKQFKQHIVPFVITTRKIFTVVISIVFYGHETTLFQIVAIVLIFVTASYEYLSEIYAGEGGKAGAGHGRLDNSAIVLEDEAMSQEVEMEGLGEGEGEGAGLAVSAGEQVNIVGAVEGQEQVETSKEQANKTSRVDITETVQVMEPVANKTSKIDLGDIVDVVEVVEVHQSQKTEIIDVGVVEMADREVRKEVVDMGDILEVVEVVKAAQMEQVKEEARDVVDMGDIVDVKEAGEAGEKVEAGETGENVEDGKTEETGQTEQAGETGETGETEDKGDKNKEGTQIEALDEQPGNDDGNE